MQLPALAPRSPRQNDVARSANEVSFFGLVLVCSFETMIERCLECEEQNADPTETKRPKCLREDLREEEPSLK
jgi:hypothetical protein